MRTDDFDYHLPPDRIAQHPLPNRADSRLLVLHRADQTLTSTHFATLPTYLRPGDLLVLNNSRVLPARLRGQKLPSGGEVEILLLESCQDGSWWTLLRPGKRVRPGTPLLFPGPDSSLHAVVAEKDPDGRCRITFTPQDGVIPFAERFGEVPLPPYIRRDRPDPADRERYQTVFARETGSVAAPTAGLHFTPEILEQLRSIGVRIAEVTLHVGMGTFAPVKAERVEDHPMHEERYFVPEATTAAITETRRLQGRVVAVGTTSLRVLEGATPPGAIAPVAGPGRTRLFLHPPARFQVVDALLTNFHLPRSTLLMLVSAFAAPGSTRGRDQILHAYEHAVREGYRFFSYGDAMLIHG